MSAKTVSLSADQLEQIQRAGGMLAVSDVILETIGCMRLIDPRYGSTRILPREAFLPLLALKREIEQKCNGYLFAGDQDDLEDMEYATVILSQDELEIIRDQAEMLRAQDVPPIFPPWAYRRMPYATSASEQPFSRKEQRRTFPVVDYVIHFGTGRYEGMVQSFYIKKNLGSRTSWPIVPVNHHDVFTFCRTCMREDGTIDAALKNEFLWHTRTHLLKNLDVATRNRIRAHYDRLFSFLERELHSIVRELCPPRVVWNGDPLVVREKRWYLGMDNGQRYAAVRMFLNAVFKRQIDADSEDMTRLEIIFPEILAEEGVFRSANRAFVTEREIEARLAQAFATQDFRGIPSIAYTDPRYSENFLSRFEPVYTDILRAIAAEDSEYILGDVRKDSSRLPIPSMMVSHIVCRRALAKVRIETVQRLNDIDFLRCVDGVDGGGKRLGGFGKAATDLSLPEAAELLDLVTRRYHTLRG